MTRLEEVLRRICDDLQSLGKPFALVGGHAVSARTEPRFTRDADLAVSVSGDREAEELLFELQQRGYVIDALVEQTRATVIATARLRPPTAPGLIVDLLFGSSGIESEIARDAETLEVTPDLVVPVARTGHLIALKLLARDDRTRPQDAADLRGLVRVATVRDREDAQAATKLIQARGFARGRDLPKLLARAFDEFG